MNMTDNEKAAEYVSKQCVNCIRYYCKKQNKKKIGSIDCCNEYLFQRKHFLAGLAEGKPKWHDLREDPNDLPKEIEICSNPVYVISPHGNSDLAQYDYKSKLWCYKHSNEHILYEVIAWCELPKFEEQ